MLSRYEINNPDKNHDLSITIYWAKDQQICYYEERSESHLQKWSSAWLTVAIPKIAWFTGWAAAVWSANASLQPATSRASRRANEGIKLGLKTPKWHYFPFLAQHELRFISKTKETASTQNKTTSNPLVRLALTSSTASTTATQSLPRHDHVARQTVRS